MSNSTQTLNPNQGQNPIKSQTTPKDPYSNEKDPSANPSTGRKDEANAKGGMKDGGGSCSSDDKSLKGGNA